MHLIKKFFTASITALVLTTGTFFGIALAYNWSHNPSTKNNGDMFTATDWNTAVNAISELHTNVNNAQTLANNAQSTANDGRTRAINAQTTANTTTTRC